MNGMIERIYTNSKEPAPISLIPETLSDGSVAFDIALLETRIHCVDEPRAREAMMTIAAALRHATSGDVLHL